MGLCLLHGIFVPWDSGFAPVPAAYGQDDDGDDDDGGGDDAGDDDAGGGDEAGDDGTGGDDAGDDDAGDDGTVGGGGGIVTDDPQSQPSTRRVQRQDARPPSAPRPAPVQAPVVLPDRVPDEVVAVELTPEDLELLLAQGFRVIEETPIDVLGTVARRLRVPEGTSLTAARDIVRSLPSGQAADFNHYYRSQEGDAVACEGLNCPALALIGWQGSDLLPGLATCAAPVVIGVIDTGINPDHPTFLGKDLTVVRLSDAALSPSRAVHGTAVTALLIGDPGGRAPGLVPQAQVIAVDAFHREDGDERADVFTLVRALDRLASEGVRVINLSLAGAANETLADAIAELNARGVVLVAAAGNEGPRASPAYPAAYEGVIAVTAVDEAGQVYRRAGQGGHIDLAAPGVNVWTAASVSGVRPKTGTSFAAPFVTAAAAIILAREPGLTVADVDARLKAAARDLGDTGPDPVFGAGLVQMPDLCEAVPAAGPVDAVQAEPIPAVE
ncbi:MAG: hypothetical protein RLZZ437_2344 [Pseudomonadota bacterium]